MADDTKKLEPGDVVALKSGGPIMTIGEITGDTAMLVWWNKRDNCFHEEQDVLLAVLKRVPPPQSDS